MKYACVMSVNPATLKNYYSPEQTHLKLEIKIYIWWKRVGGPRVREKWPCLCLNGSVIHFPCCISIVLYFGWLAHVPLQGP